ncbi:family 43 glycosylhydrolase [Sphingorhabdus sp.]|uniref:family 43 glycosylhydrolase n=1 Tax=Sphingorhabdus sp. TaxID=1902408 RepID=UPI00391AA721
MKSRRDALRFAVAGVVTAPAMVGTDVIAALGTTKCQTPVRSAAPEPWARGIEGQRKADLGNGRYLNPILSGDYPDPTVLKDGDDYYMTHSSFEASPGLLIWHSRDLVNWTPIGPALAKPLGIVFAPELIKHKGRYFIYIPFMRAAWSDGLASFANIYAIHAESIHGPWSDPVDLGISELIDPGHMVGEDEERYLFLSAGKRIRLTADGLATTGAIETVYEGWRYPDDWITEAYALEGPKLFRRGGYFYFVSAVGGTGGPPTGHMIIVSRSRSIHGPWEHCPHNPIQRTQSANEMWWSRGHATCIEGTDGRWYMVYHGYENGYRSLGRQTLLEPIEWTDDGWFKAAGGDLSLALSMPAGSHVTHGMARSDDFSSPSLGTRWNLHASAPSLADRVQLADNVLSLTAKGAGPHDGSVLIQQVGDRAYEVSVEVELTGTAKGGLLLFFNDRLFLGMGIDGQRMITYRGGKPSYWREAAPACKRLFLRIVNDRQIVTFYYSRDGEAWTRHGVRSEVSGYNANTMDDLVSLRPALFAAGDGAARFRNFTYRALK